MAKRNQRRGGAEGGSNGRGFVPSAETRGLRLRYESNHQRAFCCACSRRIATIPSTLRKDAYISVLTILDL
jgi:hypothetical protein